MSHASAQRLPCLPRTPKPAARHLRALRRPAPFVVTTGHVFAVTVAVAAAAIALAIAFRPQAPSGASVTWIALPDVPVEAAAVVHAVAAPALIGDAAAAALGARAGAAVAAYVAVPGRAAPAARKAGASMFDDPDAVEDHTVGRALPAGSRPTDRVSRADFQRELAAMGAR